MDNLVKINGREAHLIGVQKVQLGRDVYYDLSAQKHNPYFVIVLDGQERHTKKKKQENIINGN